MFRNRRLERAQQAGEQAVRDARAYQESYLPEALMVDLIVDEENSEVRWLIWDANRDYSSPLVEGVLVPYALGTVRIRGSFEGAMAEATRQAYDSVNELCNPAGLRADKATYHIRVPLLPIETTQSDTPS